MLTIRQPARVFKVSQEFTMRQPIGPLESVLVIIVAVIILAGRLLDRHGKS
jgi:hypothetical protein